MQYAILDIGTNSVILLAARCLGSEPPAGLREWSRITRLGQGIARPGDRLRPEAMDRTVAAVRALLEQLCRSVPAGAGVATATSAVRDAANGAEFLEQCGRILGAPPRLLSGTEEAETAFAGAASELPPDLPAVTVDVGGGSTEVAAGTAGRCEARASLPLGCVRFTEAFRLDASSGQAGIDAAVDRIRRELRNGLPAVLARVRRMPRPPVFVASGGTATTYAAWRLRLAPYDPDRVHGFRESLDRLAGAVRHWLALPAAERSRQPGVSPARGPVLAAGLFILFETLNFLGCNQFQVTVRGLRYGLLLALCEHRTAPDWRWPRA